MKKYLLILSILLITSTSVNAEPSRGHHPAKPPHEHNKVMAKPSMHHGATIHHHGARHKIVVHPRPPRYHRGYSVWWNYSPSRYYYDHHLDCMCYDCRRFRYGFGSGININLRF